MTPKPSPDPSEAAADAAATRAAIFEAATRRFAYQGYEHAGVREIAADAGVDAAMVNRYFGSKEGLFAEVVEHAFDYRYLTDGDRATLAERLARKWCTGGRTPRTMTHTVTAHAALRHGTPRGRAAQAEPGPQRPAAARRVPRRPRRRGPGHDVIAQCTGFAILYQMLRPRALAEAQQEELVVLLKESLAACIGRVPRDGPRTHSIEPRSGRSRYTAGDRPRSYSAPASVAKLALLHNLGDLPEPNAPTDSAEEAFSRPPGASVDRGRARQRGA